MRVQSRRRVARVINKSRVQLIASKLFLSRGRETLMSANEAITNEQITQRNEMLFNSFRKKFQSLVEKDYIDSVHKFKSWLSDRRAYYDAARPRVSIYYIFIRLTEGLKSAFRS